MRPMTETFGGELQEELNESVGEVSQPSKKGRG
jgi:hypothetical protein